MPTGPLLKVKVGGDGDIERIRAVVEAAPNSRIILDANEGWTDANLAENLAAAAELGVALIEQPLPAGRDAMLRYDRASGADLRRRKRPHRGRPAAARGPLRRGQHQARQGRRADGGDASCATRPAPPASRSWSAAWSAPRSPWRRPCCSPQDADFVDLDGPLLLARDRSPALAYSGSLVSPPEPALWG